MLFSFASYCFDKYKKFLTHNYKDYSFNIDLKFGKLYLTRKLFALPGKYLPIDLSFKYIEAHTTSTQTLHQKTGLPIGVKTNYHLFLEYNTTYGQYWLEDADGFLHVFKLADNSTTLYFDRNGSGLMMKTIPSGCYKVFDDYGNYQLFDSNGRLILIHQHIANNHTAELTISYMANYPEDSLRIYSITDSYNNAIYFSYTSSGVQITYNNNVVITISQDSNNYLTALTKNLGDNHIITETFNCDPLLHTITLDDGETFSLNYYDDKVSYLISSINHCRYAFDYSLGENKVRVNDSGGVNTFYDLNQEQSFNQFSHGNTNLSYQTLSSEHLSCLVKEANDDEVLEFVLDNSGQTPSYIYDMAYYENYYQTPFSSNANLESKKAYLFCAKIIGTMAVDDTFTIELKDDDGNLLSRLIYERGTTFLAAPIGIKESTQRSFYLNFLKPFSNRVVISEVKIVPLIGSFEMFCSNISTDEPIFFYGNTPYYLLTSGKGVYLNNGNTLYDYRLSMNDYLINERLLYISDTSTHYWFNDQKGLADNISSLSIKETQYMNMLFSSNPKFIKHSYMYPAPDALFYRISGKDDCSLKITKISHNSAFFPTGHTNYHYEEEITNFLAASSGHVSIYDYDSNYLLQKVTNNDGTYEEYSYDSNGNLLEHEISNNTDNDTISEQFTYDIKDNVISESKLVGDTVFTSTYSYDSTNKHSETNYPNLLTETHFFDSITKERETGIRFSSSDSLYIEQNNNYIAEDTYSLSTDGNTHLIGSYHGEVRAIEYNNNQTLEIVYAPNIYQDIVMDYRYYYRFANGYEYYDEYDNFRRIISSDGVTYDYDDYNNVTSITDPFVQEIDPNNDPDITYEYDYYDQLVATSIEYSNLSMTYQYDKYHRLISTSSLYDASFEYHDTEDMEKVIKKTLIEDGSESLVIEDEVDAFKRLTKRSIGINNKYSYVQYEYYHGDLDNSRTNKLIKKASYYNIINHLPFLERVDEYEYDNMGNINKIATTVGQTTHTINYYYDKYSRLIKEENEWFNKAYQYSYDDKGNILKISSSDYPQVGPAFPFNPITANTHFYDSTYPDRLIRFELDSLTYDNYGNPLTYGSKTLTWTRGTLLSSVSEGNNIISFNYDGFKQRIRKTVNNVVTDYKYIDNRLLVENRNGYAIKYYYSHAGVIGFEYDNDIYIYEKNIQQDVIAIRDSNNQIVAKYIYDACGNHKVLNSYGHVNNSDSFIGNINPIRYRSYYYDSDLKMYWLTSRYYDPRIARFISPDSWEYLNYKKLHSLNLYTYSKNNPVMYYDPSGHFIFELLTIIFLISSVARTTAIKAGAIEPDDSASDNTHITNSFLIINPLTELYYLWYLKYIEGKKIKGTLFGALFEWECHNFAFIYFSMKQMITGEDESEKISRSMSVDIGPTIFDDETDEWYGPAMKITYSLACVLILCRPDYLLNDLLTYLLGKK